MMPSSLNVTNTGDFWLEFLHLSPPEMVLTLGGIVLIVLGLVLTIFVTIVLIQFVIDSVREHKQKPEEKKDDA